MIEATCGGCGTTFAVDESHAGKSGKCRKCGGSVRIPPPSPATAVSIQPVESGNRESTPDNAEALPQLQITTTEAIHGWNITAYHGVVSSHTVAGTGFFSDFAAGITDLFGGRSQTYQRQLAAIEEEAMDALRHAAVERGANWIVGVRVDFDEISGKGMQMFMVSARGTAVQAVAMPSDARPGVPVTVVPGTAISDRLRRDFVVARLRSIEAGEREVTEELLEALCATRTPEAIPLCIRLLTRNAQNQSTSEKMEKLARQALRMAPRQAVRNAVQEIMLRQSSQNVMDIYRDLGLLDLRWVLKQIESVERSTRKVGLQALCCCVAANYASSDISVLQAIKHAIPVGFPETCQHVEVKGLLGGKPVTKWRCDYGHDNLLESRRCDICGFDRHGLPLDYSVAGALHAVESTLAVLEEQFRP